MPRALRSGARRALGRHDGPRGRLFHAHYRGLAARLGPFSGLVRDYASSVTALYVAWWDCQQALEAGQRRRREGRGRRPSATEIVRLQKRHGLAWASYDAALRRLEELAARNGQTLDLARAIAAAQEHGS